MADQPRLRPTLRAWCLVVCGLLLLAGGVYLGRPELVAAGAGLVLLPVLSFAWVLLSTRLVPSRGPLPTRRVSGERVEGAPIAVSLLVPGDTPPAGVELLDGLIPPRVTHTGGELRYEAVLQRRGVTPLGPYLRSVSDPLGLVKGSAPWAARTWLSVQPDAPAQEPPGAAFSALGKALGAASSSPDTLTRPYRDGDPIKRIHWPVSARQGQLMMRPDGDDDEASAAVLLDVALAHYPGPSVDVPGRDGTFASTAAFEEAVRLAGALRGARGQLAPLLAAFPPVTTPTDRAAFLATIRPGSAQGVPSSTARGGVIVTGLPGEQAARWPHAWPARSVHVILVSEGGKAADEAVAKAWARAGWTTSTVSVNAAREAAR